MHMPGSVYALTCQLWPTTPASTLSCAHSRARMYKRMHGHAHTCDKSMSEHMDAHMRVSRRREIWIDRCVRCFSTQCCHSSSTGGDVGRRRALRCRIHLEKTTRTSMSKAFSQALATPRHPTTHTSKCTMTFTSRHTSTHASTSTRACTSPRTSTPLVAH